jgi:hypothetical protein
VINVTSSIKSCEPLNVLNDDETKMWMSEPGLPQAIVFDLGALSRQRGLQYTRFGFRCPKSYASNPSKIALNTSADGIKFSSWAIFTKIDQRTGTQLFSVTPRSADKCKYIEVVILATFGANRTYIGQVFLEAQESAPDSYSTLPGSVRTSYRTTTHCTFEATDESCRKHHYRRSPSNNNQVDEPQFQSAQKSSTLTRTETQRTPPDDDEIDQ